jgi:hypothetical protein
VRECGFEAQDSGVCLKLKQSGGELHGDLFTNGAICLSACPFAFMGATVHEVEPDAVLGVHSPKIIFNARRAPPEASVVAAAEERGQEVADRAITRYLARMGVGAGLLNLIRTIKFEDMHVLTRDEIVRFGLDRREFVETAWRFESSAQNTVRKIAVVKSETSFRLLQLRVACFDTDRFVLDFQRPGSAVGLSSASIADRGARPVYFNGPAWRDNAEHWNMGLTRSRLDALLNHPEVEIGETSFAADGRLALRTTKLSGEGWAGAIETLVANCPLSKGALAIQMSNQANKPNAPAAK